MNSPLIFMMIDRLQREDEKLEKDGEVIEELNVILNTVTRAIQAYTTVHVREELEQEFKESVIAALRNSLRIKVITENHKVLH